MLNLEQGVTLCPKWTSWDTTRLPQTLIFTVSLAGLGWPAFCTYHLTWKEDA